MSFFHSVHKLSLGPSLLPHLFPHQCGDTAAVWLRNDGLNWVGTRVSGKCAVGGEQKKNRLIKTKTNGTRALIKTYFHTPVSELNINGVNFAFNLHAN